MNLYEVLIIAKQDIQPTEVAKLAESLTTFVEEIEGQILKSEHGELQSLAYEIAKNRKGYYILLGIKLDRAKVAELTKKMRFNESIIRHCVFSVKAIDEEPAAFLSPAAVKTSPAPVSTI